jgi:hypothetical protein
MCQSRVSGGLGWSRVVSVGLGWSRMVSGGHEWSRMVSGGLGWSRVVSGLGSRVSCLGWYRMYQSPVSGHGSRVVSDVGYLASGLKSRVSGLESRALGLGSRVLSLGSWVPGALTGGSEKGTPGCCVWLTKQELPRAGLYQVVCRSRWPGVYAPSFQPIQCST